MALAMAHSDRLQLQLQLCPVSSRFCYYFYITCENNNRAARGERGRGNGQINTPESDSWINTSVKVQIVRALSLPDDADDELWVGRRTPRFHMSPVVHSHTSTYAIARAFICVCVGTTMAKGTRHWKRPGSGPKVSYAGRCCCCCCCVAFFRVTFTDRKRKLNA